MKALLTFLFSLLFISNLQAQQITANPGDYPPLKVSDPTILDTTVIQCKYKQNIVNNIKSRKVQENIMVLQIGNTISKYCDEKELLKDSLMDAYAVQQMDAITALNKVMPLARGASSNILFKNYPTNKITTTDYIPINNYKFEENLISPNWTLLQDTTTICGYLCKKATTTFRGRNYIAWYTQDIPLSNGPWKLTGLLGLILKASDDKQEISFECIAIEKKQYLQKIYMDKALFVKTNKKAFEKLKKEYMDNPAAFLNMSGMIKGGLPASASKKSSYNPIELSK